MSEPSVASKLVRLLAHYPCAGEEGKDFELQIPEVICQKSFDVLVQHIEFRRKCMNQGFDNLLELLRMHYDALQQASNPTEPATTLIKVPLGDRQ